MAASRRSRALLRPQRPQDTKVPNPSPALDKNCAPMGPEFLPSTGAGVWRKAPKAFPDSSSVLDKFQSASKDEIESPPPSVPWPEVLYEPRLLFATLIASHLRWAIGALGPRLGAPPLLETSSPCKHPPPFTCPGMLVLFKGTAHLDPLLSAGFGA